MKKSLVAAAIGAVLIVAGIVKYHSQKSIQPYGYGYKNKLTEASGEVTNFSLLDHAGVFHELYRRSDVDFLVFVSHQMQHTPDVLLLKDLKKTFEKKKVDFYMINSGPQDKRTDIIEWADKNKIDIPVLLDPSQLITEALGLTAVPQVIILNTRGWRKVYSAPLNEKLKGALEKVSSNMAAGFESVDTLSPVQFLYPQKISFEKDVKPIVLKKCLYCHASERGFLPYLDSYEKLRNWTAMMRETIVTERMPPFSADTLYGTYQNDSSLSPREKVLFVKWIDQGAPYDGPDGKAKFPPPVQSDNSLKNIKPVYRATMDKPIEVPASGKVEYSYTQLGGPAPYDMWVEAIRFHSDNPRQLHHVSLMVTSKPLSFYEQMSAEKNPQTHDENLRKQKQDGDIELFILGTLVNYESENNPNYARTQVFGAGRRRTVLFRQGTGLFIKKGSFLILESHHMGTGRDETEKTTLEFFGKLEKKASLRQLHNKTLTNWKLKIPPMVSHFKVETGEWKIDRKVGLLSMLGHLHMRGRAIKLFATTPEGKKITVSSIPNYYYGWQTGSGLVLKEPMIFAPGTVFKSECTFDNSPYNPFNPDPQKTVLFGQRVDRTEMCLMHLSFFYPEENLP